MQEIMMLPSARQWVVCGVAHFRANSSEGSITWKENLALRNKTKNVQANKACTESIYEPSKPSKQYIARVN